MQRGGTLKDPGTIGAHLELQDEQRIGSDDAESQPTRWVGGIGPGEVLIPIAGTVPIPIQGSVARIAGRKALLLFPEIGQFVGVDVLG